MYDLNLARKLCARIAIYDDPDSVPDMLKLLAAIVQENNEEVWMRMTLLENKCAQQIYDRLTASSFSFFFVMAGIAPRIA